MATAAARFREVWFSKCSSDGREFETDAKWFSAKKPTYRAQFNALDAEFRPALVTLIQTPGCHDSGSPSSFSDAAIFVDQMSRNIAATDAEGARTAGIDPDSADPVAVGLAVKALLAACGGGDGGHRCDGGGDGALLLERIYADKAETQQMHELWRDAITHGDTATMDRVLAFFRPNESDAIGDPDACGALARSMLAMTRPSRFAELGFLSLVFRHQAMQFFIKKMRVSTNVYMRMPLVFWRQRTRVGFAVARAILAAAVDELRCRPGRVVLPGQSSPASDPDPPASGESPSTSAQDVSASSQDPATSARDQAAAVFARFYHESLEAEHKL